MWAIYDVLRQHNDYKSEQTCNIIIIRQIIYIEMFTFYLKKSKKIQKLIDFNG